MAGISPNQFESAFKSLYRPLCLFAMRYLEAIDDAEDIVQQAFADAWTKNKEGEAILHLKAYLYQTVRNRSLNLIEQSPDLRSVELLGEMIDESDDEQIVHSERDARLWEAIDALPPERRKIFLLSKRDGMKYKEIADDLKISIKTVENQMGKALKALRESVKRIYLFFFS